MRLPDDRDIERLLARCAADLGMEVSDLELTPSFSTFDLHVAEENPFPDEIVLSDFLKHCGPSFVAEGGRVSAGLLIDEANKQARRRHAAAQAAARDAELARLADPNAGPPPEDLVGVGTAGRTFRYSCTLPALKRTLEQSEAAAAAEQMGGGIRKWAIVRDDTAVFHLVFEETNHQLNSEIRTTFKDLLTRETGEHGPFGASLTLMSAEVDAAYRDETIEDFYAWLNDEIRRRRGF